MALDRARFAATLLDLNSVGLDSAALIYHLEDVLPYADLTEELFALIGHGKIEAVLSVVTVAELLVGPFTQGQAAQVAGFEHFLQALPNTKVVPVSYEIARESARLRACYRLRTPDALLAATALAARAGGFVTNDAQLRRIEPEGIKVVVLKDFI